MHSAVLALAVRVVTFAQSDVLWLVAGCQLDAKRRIALNVAPDELVDRNVGHSKFDRQIGASSVNIELAFVVHNHDSRVEILTKLADCGLGFSSVGLDRNLAELSASLLSDRVKERLTVFSGLGVLVCFSPQFLLFFVVEIPLNFVSELEPFLNDFLVTNQINRKAGLAILSVHEVQEGVRICVQPAIKQVNKAMTRLPVIFDDFEDSLFNSFEGRVGLLFVTALFLISTLVLHFISDGLHVYNLAVDNALESSAHCGLARVFAASEQSPGNLSAQVRLKGACVPVIHGFQAEILCEQTVETLASEVTISDFHSVSVSGCSVDHGTQHRALAFENCTALD